MCRSSPGLTGAWVGCCCAAAKFVITIRESKARTLSSLGGSPIRCVSYLESSREGKSANSQLADRKAGFIICSVGMHVDKRVHRISQAGIVHRVETVGLEEQVAPQSLERAIDRAKAGKPCGIHRRSIIDVPHAHSRVTPHLYAHGPKWEDTEPTTEADDIVVVMDASRVPPGLGSREPVQIRARLLGVGAAQQERTGENANE